MIPAPFVSSVISSRSTALARQAATAFSMSATGKRAMTVTLVTAASFDGPTTSAEEVRPSYDISLASAQDAESGIAVSSDTDLDAGAPLALDGCPRRAGVGIGSLEDRHAGRFLLALDETGPGGGDPGRRVHLGRAHCGLGIEVGCDHLNVAAL